MIHALRAIVASIGLGGMLLAGCGSAATPLPPAPGSRSLFVICTGAGNSAPKYAILDSPGPDCKQLTAGQDYAEGRVIVGLRAGTGDAQLGQALAAYHATVISSNPTLENKVLSVPAGAVPQAVIGLATYPFITFASPDMIAHVDMNT